jgi:predicted adenylyl cyclase CyaB
MIPGVSYNIFNYSISMSHNSNSIEIEQKFYLPDSKPLTTWLEKNAKFKHRDQQVDVYYTPAHNDYLAKDYPTEFFRIRNSEGKFSTTYKNWHEIDENLNHAYCDEFETEISNGDQFQKMILALGFTARITVDKVRSSYEYHDCEIDIDEIKGLGSFCEIEIHGEYSDVAEAHKQIEKLAQEMGITDFKDGPDTTGGYAMMIFRQNTQ